MLCFSGSVTFVNTAKAPLSAPSPSAQSSRWPSGNHRLAPRNSGAAAAAHSNGQQLADCRQGTVAHSGFVLCRVIRNLALGVCQHASVPKRAPAKGHRVLRHRTECGVPQRPSAALAGLGDPLAWKPRESFLQQQLGDGVTGLPLPVAQGPIWTNWRTSSLALNRFQEFADEGHGKLYKISPLAHLQP